MAEPTKTPVPSRSTVVRWLPWVAVLVVVALLLFLVRPSDDDEAGVESGSADPATEEPVASCDDRQLSVSDYGPCATPPFDGDNGGETAPGVTADTITITYRLGNSGQLGALNAIAGDAAASLGSNQQAVVEDINTLVAYFNEQFELHGRRVELESFEGQGDFLAEFQGKDAQGAQVDSARAADLGAFADVSFTTMTQPYAEALAASEIIAMSPVYLSDDWYADHAPFAYGAAWPVGDQMAEFAGNAVCEIFAGAAASGAGGSLTDQDRSFGLLAPENPEYAKMADAMESVLNECGESVARRLSFALDVAALQSEATNAVAQMKDAGVTTIVCLCDEFSPLFLTTAAVDQQYEPEWLMQRWPDPWGRQTDQSAFSRSLHLGGATPDFETSEIGRVLDEATDGSGASSPESIDAIYRQLLLLFSGLQEAGPELTPESFQAGVFSLPATADGVLGPWEFGDGVFNPNTSFQLGWWSPDEPSTLDDIAGSVQDCAPAGWYRYDDIEGLGAVADTLECGG